MLLWSAETNCYATEARRIEPLESVPGAADVTYALGSEAMAHCMNLVETYCESKRLEKSKRLEDQEVEPADAGT